MTNKKIDTGVRLYRGSFKIKAIDAKKIDDAAINAKRKKEKIMSLKSYYLPEYNETENNALECSNFNMSEKETLQWCAKHRYLLDDQSYSWSQGVLIIVIDRITKAELFRGYVHVEMTTPTFVVDVDPDMCEF